MCIIRLYVLITLISAQHKNIQPRKISVFQMLHCATASRNKFETLGKEKKGNHYISIVRYT